MTLWLANLLASVTGIIWAAANFQLPKIAQPKHHTTGHTQRRALNQKLPTASKLIKKYPVITTEAEGTDHNLPSPTPSKSPTHAKIVYPLLVAIFKLYQRLTDEPLNGIQKTDQQVVSSNKVLLRQLAGRGFESTVGVDETTIYSCNHHSQYHENR